MYCGNCGKELKENAKFCGNCGNEVKIEGNIKSDTKNFEEEKKETKEFIKKTLKKIIIVVLVFLAIVAIISGIIVSMKRKTYTNVQYSNDSSLTNVSEDLGISKEDENRIKEMYGKINENGTIQEAYYFEELNTYYLWVIYSKNSDILYCTVSYSDSINNAKVVKHYGSEKIFVNTQYICTYKEANTSILNGLKQRDDVLVLTGIQFNSLINVGADDLQILENNVNTNIDVEDEEVTVNEDYEEMMNSYNKNNSNNESNNNSSINNDEKDNSNTNSEVITNNNNNNNSVEKPEETFTAPVINANIKIEKDILKILYTLGDNYDDTLNVTIKHNGTIIMNDNKAVSVNKTHTQEIKVTEGTHKIEMITTNSKGKTTTEKFTEEFNYSLPTINVYNMTDTTKNEEIGIRCFVTDTYSEGTEKNIHLVIKNNGTIIVDTYVMSKVWEDGRIFYTIDRRGEQN